MSLHNSFCLLRPIYRLSLVTVELQVRMDASERLEIDIHAVCWILVLEVLPPQRGALDQIV